MTIITDTPSLFSPKNNIEEGLTVIPACTVLSGHAYKDISDIESFEFLDRIAKGEVATSSQPSVGDIIDAYEGTEGEILVLPIGNGLSGTYGNMVSAAELACAADRIHILDTGTLAGPQHYIVKKALALRKEGASLEEIKEKLMPSIESAVSFVIPSDFEFLKRSGRLTPFAAKLGTVMKIVPVMTQTDDKKKITRFCIKTSKKSALDAVIRRLKELNVGEGWLISVSHGGVEDEAADALLLLQQSFEAAKTELFLLPPSLVCHGGPGCILVQAVKL